MIETKSLTARFDKSAKNITQSIVEKEVYLDNVKYICTNVQAREHDTTKYAFDLSLMRLL